MSNNCNNNETGSKVFNNNRILIIDIIDDNIILKFNFGEEYIEYEIRPGLINAYLDLERLLDDIINDSAEKPKINLLCNAAEHENITICIRSKYNMYRLNIDATNIVSGYGGIGFPITKDDAYILIKSIIEITKNN